MHVVAFLSGCVVWIPIALMVVSLVGWMIAGEVEPIPGLIGLFVTIWLGFLALQPPAPWVAPLTVVVAVATCVLYPFLRQGIANRELRSVDVDGLGKAYESLALRPDNAVARFRVAQLAWNLGMTGHALRIGEAAIQQMPVATFRTEHRTVQGWQAYGLPHEAFRPLPCPRCGTPNAPGELYCTRCKAPFLYERFRVLKSGGTNGLKILAAWVVMVALITGLPMAGALPPVAAILVVVFGLVLAALALWYAFRPREATV